MMTDYAEELGNAMRGINETEADISAERAIRDFLVHKFNPPARVSPISLKSAVLCVSKSPNLVVMIDIVVSNSIYQVTCPQCLELWAKGVYL